MPSEITFVSLPKALAQFHHLPEHVPVWLHKLKETKKQGYDFDSGAGAMEDLLRTVPNVPGAFLFRLFVRRWPKLRAVNPLLEADRVAEAIPGLVEALDIDPECPITCFQLGYCFRATGELEKSESFYKQALRMAPDAGWIYSNLGRTYLAMAARDKALEAFWKALELLPGDQFVLEQLVLLGELYIIPKGTTGNRKSLQYVRKADYEKERRKALEGEKSPEGLVKLGWTLLRDHLPALAGQSFEKALQVKPETSEAFLGAGISRLEEGRYREAEKYLLEYLDLEPGSATAHLNLFKAYLAMEEAELAWEEIQSAAMLDPDRLEVLRQLYFLYVKADRAEEGLKCLETLEREKPASYGPSLVRAQALAELDRWEEAEKSLREALTRSPRNEEILLFYTSELGKRGKREDVIRIIQGEPKPHSLGLTINLALALGQNGRFAEGKKVLEEFLKQSGLSRQDRKGAEEILREFEKGGKKEKKDS